MERDSQLDGAQSATIGTWDHETDLLVIGSGAAGLTTALVAKLEGLDSLVLEKTALIGGSTALSGGGIWIPNNHLMEQAGLPDSFENACLYLESTVGDRTPKKKQEAFVTNSRAMLKYLSERASIKFCMGRGFPDYYPERPGGVNEGRTVYAATFSGQKLGRDFDRLRDHEHSPPKWVQFDLEEFKNLFLCKTNPNKLFTVFRSILRIAFSLLLWHKDVTMGKGLAACLFHALKERNVSVWTNAKPYELVLDNGKVVGVLVKKAGRRIAIRVRKGVMLAAGGFAHNLSMREEFMPKPASTEWTLAANGNTGDTIRIGVKTGAAVDLMDDAWWGPTTVTPGKKPLFLLMERSYPGSILVNSAGKRFSNEAASYIDVGHDMYENNGKGGISIPAHFIIDQRFRGNYFLGLLPWRYTPQKLVKSGYIKKSATLRGLAIQAGIDPDGLETTVERFNTFARTGKDLDFKRGDSEYDRSYADPSVKPNPSLAPIEKPPFYSVHVHPGDLGTKGGLVTNEYAQVLREDGSIIEGLYAAGNTSASVMGNTYPGGGGTLGPAMTFGYIAGMHAANQ